MLRLICRERRTQLLASISLTLVSQTTTFNTSQTNIPLFAGFGCSMLTGRSQARHSYLLDYDCVGSPPPLLGSHRPPRRPPVLNCPGEALRERHPRNIITHLDPDDQNATKINALGIVRMGTTVRLGTPRRSISQNWVSTRTSNHYYHPRERI